DMLQRQVAAQIGAPDGYQHLDLSINRPGHQQFSPQGGGGGDINAAQWLQSMGYQGRVVGRTPGPQEGMMGGGFPGMMGAGGMLGGGGMFGGGGGFPGGGMPGLGGGGFPGGFGGGFPGGGFPGMMGGFPGMGGGFPGMGFNPMMLLMGGMGGRMF